MNLVENLENVLSKQEDITFATSDNTLNEVNIFKKCQTDFENKLCLLVGGCNYHWQSSLQRKSKW